MFSTPADPSSLCLSVKSLFVLKLRAVTFLDEKLIADDNLSMHWLFVHNASTLLYCSAPLIFLSSLCLRWAVTHCFCLFGIVFLLLFDLFLGCVPYLLLAVFDHSLYLQ